MPEEAAVKPTKSQEEERTTSGWIPDREKRGWVHLDVALVPEDWIAFKKYAISLRMPVTQVARAILYPCFSRKDK